MKIWTRDETRLALPFDELIPALRDMFEQGCEVPVRHVHRLPLAGGDEGVVLIMPAWQPGGLMGIKTVNIFAGNAARGLPGLHALYALYDAQTGQPLAMLDGSEITSRRTAAASALAASYLACPRSASLLVVGSGQVASLLPEAYRTVLPIERVMWSPNGAHSAALAERLAVQGFDAQVVADLAHAAGQADIVSCATLSKQPLV
jgi:ornithine cyclodeaminase